jgi:AmiR/NasT family two-component response regulator
LGLAGVRAVGHVTSQVQATREVRIDADGGSFGRKRSAARARISGSLRDGARSQACRRETNEAVRDLSGDHREPIDSKLCRDPNPPRWGSAAHPPSPAGTVEPRSAERHPPADVLRVVTRSQRAGAGPSSAPARSVDSRPDDGTSEHLRVLIANERKDRLALVAPIVVALGHEVIAREVSVEDVGAVTARERPDVALVGLGKSSEHALGLIETIVRAAACPVIVLLHSRDPGFVKEASKRGVFAHISDADVEDWQSSIDIVLRRFAEYHDLQGAFGRRALTERATGILMERHAVSEESAFEMLRERSHVANRKLIDLAAAVVDGHRLLSKHPKAPPAS